jgi:hypothetical protein
VLEEAKRNIPSRNLNQSQFWHLHSVSVGYSVHGLVFRLVLLHVESASLDGFRWSASGGLCYNIEWRWVEAVAAEIDKAVHVITFAPQLLKMED